MKKRHAALISLLLTTAVALGAVAAAHSVTGKTSARVQRAPDYAISVRQHRLDQLERSIRRSLASKPPTLPPAAHYAPVYIPRVTPVPIPAPVPVVQSVEPKSVAGHERRRVRDAEPKTFTPTTTVVPTTTTTSTTTATTVPTTTTEHGDDGELEPEGATDSPPPAEGSTELDG